MIHPVFKTKFQTALPDGVFSRLSCESCCFIFLEELPLASSSARQNARGTNRGTAGNIKAFQTE